MAESRIHGVQPVQPNRGRYSPGGIISPVLANLALDGLEAVLESHFGIKNTKMAYKHKVNFVRYADDFVITGISKELLENEVKPIVESFMAERGLVLSKEKTIVTHISEGFDFLGQNVRKYANGKLLIKPSHKSMRNVLDKVKSIIKGNKSCATHVLIAKLNPVLRGWGNYHRGVVSKKTFNYIDYRVWKLLWQWCRRTHGNRNKRWIKAKYFKRVGKRNWVFQAPKEGGKGIRTLFYVNDIPIKRHTKIQSEANFYDPTYEEYFEARQQKRWEETYKGRKKLMSLWREQEGRCLVCNLPITSESGWHIHHLVHRTNGGSDRLCNLVLLHPVCHVQVHSLGINICKTGIEY